MVGNLGVRPWAHCLFLTVLGVSQAYPFHHPTLMFLMSRVYPGACSPHSFLFPIPSAQFSSSLRIKRNIDSTHIKLLFPQPGGP